MATSFSSLAQRLMQKIDGSPNSSALQAELAAFGQATLEGRRPVLHMHSPLVHMVAPLLSNMSRMGVSGVGHQQRQYTTAVARLNAFWGKRADSSSAGGGVEALKRLEREANQAADNVQAQGRYLQELYNSGFGGEVISRVESGRFACTWSILELYTKCLEEGGRFGQAGGVGAGGARQRLAELWASTDKTGVGSSASAFLPPTSLTDAVYGSSYGQGRSMQGAAGGAGYGQQFVPGLPPSPYGAPVAPGGSYGYGAGGSGGPGYGYVPMQGGGGWAAAAAPAAATGGGGYASPPAFTPSGPASSSAPVGGSTGQGFPGTRVNPIVVEMQPGKGSMWMGALRIILTIAFMAFLYNSMTKGMPGGALAALTGEATEEVTDIPTTRFADVKGVDEAKQELQDVVAFLRDPERFKRLGAKVPRGVLLTGPPGTGKTLLARAVAGEAGCKFYSKSASEFEEMLVGLGAKRVRDLFNAARKNAPAIIFIDEIDALGGKRRLNIGSGSERQTLNQLLSSMDGFSKNENVIVIGATNSPDILDPALVRPGRFDSTVDVPLPDVKGRKEIIDLYLSKMVVAQGVDADLLARATPGFSGAQLEALVNSAALMAANRGGDSIEMQDIEEARDKLIMGPAKKSRVRRADQMRLTAYHEGGHTLTAMLTRGTNPLHKVTILPRGFSGGATYSLPRDDELMTRETILAQIDVCMGGRAAEELVYGREKITVGAGMDMQQASDLARRFCMMFSMSSLGLSSYAGTEPSPDRRAAIDTEVEAILQASYKRVLDLLTEQRGKLDKLASALVEHETLTAEEVQSVLDGKVLPSLKERMASLAGRSLGGGSSGQGRGGRKGLVQSEAGEGGSGSKGVNLPKPKGAWHTSAPSQDSGWVSTVLAFLPQPWAQPIAPAVGLSVAYKSTEEDAEQENELEEGERALIRDRSHRDAIVVRAAAAPPPQPRMV